MGFNTTETKIQDLLPTILATYESESIIASFKVKLLMQKNKT